MNLKSETMKTQVMQITPELAREMLENNNNRKLDMNHVHGLAQSIMRGKWVLSPDGISFDRAGNLINGQHRLNAVIKAGRAVPMIVTLGCDDSAIGVLDQGKSRSKLDHMKMFADEKKYYTNPMCITAVRGIVRRRNKHMESSLSNAEFEEIMNLNDDAIHVFYLAMGSHSNAGMTATDYAALFEAMLVTKDVEALIAYRKAFSLGKIDPGANYNYGVAVSLRNRVMNERLHHRKTDAKTAYNLTQSAFNAFRSARKTNYVRNTNDDCFRVDLQKYMNGDYNDAFVGMDAIYG